MNIKRTLAAIITIVMVGGGIFHACSKDEITIVNTKIKGGKELKASTWWRIVRADATGALLGSVAYLAGPVVGTIFTVGTGVAASVARAAEIKAEKAEAARTEAKNVEALLPDIEDDSPADNEDNPYDYIGRTHYLFNECFFGRPKPLL